MRRSTLGSAPEGDASRRGGGLALLPAKAPRGGGRAHRGRARPARTLRGPDRPLRLRRDDRRRPDATPECAVLDGHRQPRARRVDPRRLRRAGIDDRRVRRRPAGHRAGDPDRRDERLRRGRLRHRRAAGRGRLAVVSVPDHRPLADGRLGAGPAERDPRPRGRGRRGWRSGPAPRSRSPSTGSTCWATPSETSWTRDCAARPAARSAEARASGGGGATMDLVSDVVTAADYEEAVELCFARGWTDGLPVVLPTRRRVEGLIEHAGRDPQEG